MLRFLKKIILFTLLFFAVNYAYLLIIEHYNYDFKKSIEAVNMEHQNYSCLALGNSLVMDGIDAELLTKKGLSSYNFAIGGANLKSNYIQLIHYLENNENPKFVLLGTTSLNSLERKKSDEAIHPIIEYNYKPIDWLNYKNLPMIKFRWLSIEMLKLLVSSDHRMAEVVLGQYKTKRQVGDKTGFKNKSNKQINLKALIENKYLSKIDSICKENDIRFLVVEMPGYKKSQNSMDIGPFSLKNMKNDISFINLNNHNLCSELFNDNSDWLGNSHLNEYGAEKLTNYIFEKFLSQNLNNIK